MFKCYTNLDSTPRGHGIAYTVSSHRYILLRISASVHDLKKKKNLKFGIEEIYLNIMEAINDKSSAKIIVSKDR